MTILDIRALPVTKVKFDDSGNYIRLGSHTVYMVEPNSHSSDTPICTKESIPDLIKALEYLNENN